MKNIFLAFALLFLVGCEKEAKTKAYYTEHLDEAKIKVQKCKKLEKFNEIEQIDCQNASSALFFAPDSRVPYGKGKNNWEGKSRPDIYKNF